MGRVLAECLCPKACDGQHLPGFRPRVECLAKSHFLSPGTVCHPWVWGWTFYLCENWDIPAMLQHEGCVCISATFPPQHLSGPDSHHKPEQSSAPNQFYIHFPGTALVLSFKSAEKALQLRVGRCDQDCMQVQHIFLLMMEKQIVPPSRGIWASSWSQMQCVRQCSGANSAPLRDMMVQTSGFWHKCCGWEKRKLMHKAMEQDPWAVFPCAAEVSVTSLHLDSLWERWGSCLVHSEGRWRIWGSLLMVFSMQEESVQSLLVCAPKNSASMWTVFSIWLWKLSPGRWCWTFGELW